MILESREVTKKYGGKTAVNQVSLQLEQGLVYAMLGPNGSGKTTWMKMVAGLVKPTSGEILYQGIRCIIGFGTNIFFSTYAGCWY